MDKIILDGSSLTLEKFENIVLKDQKVAVKECSQEDINYCRKVVEDIISQDKIRYGITTGFGKFSNVKINGEDTKRLQRKIVLSHAVGVGKPFSKEVVKGMMLLKLNSFILGRSGVRPECVHTLVEMINKNVIPVVPEKGSVGASGDLAPLSHMALVIIGEGEAYYQGERLPGSVAMKKAGIDILELAEKEGLALLNGTQTMTSLASLALIQAHNIIKIADIAGAMSLEALKGTPMAFDERIHKLRPHLGQINTAKNLRIILQNSKMYNSPEDYTKVQDAYSLRCMPQVHGASKDAFNYIKGIIETELNSVTDNPLVFPDKQDVISGGNFHGQPLALVMDFLKIAISELANISERRIQYMMDPSTNDELPAFLVNNGGLNSGYMMIQVTAAALVSDNKSYCHPDSVDSIPTSANKEDHVSMGTNAARKVHIVLENVKNVLAIELLCSAQALDFRKPLIPATAIDKIHKHIRKNIPFMEEDRNIHLDINTMNEILDKKELIEICEKESGEIII